MSFFCAEVFFTYCSCYFQIRRGSITSEGKVSLACMSVTNSVTQYYTVFVTICVLHGVSDNTNFLLSADGNLWQMHNKSFVRGALPSLPTNQHINHPSYESTSLPNHQPPFGRCTISNLNFKYLLGTLPSLPSLPTNLLSHQPAFANLDWDGDARLWKQSQRE